MPTNVDKIREIVIRRGMESVPPLLSCRAAPMFVRRYVCAQNSCNNCNDCNGEGDDGGLLWHLLNAALQGKSVWILDCLFGKVYFCSGNSLMELKQSHEWT